MIKCVIELWLKMNCVCVLWVFSNSESVFRLAFIEARVWVYFWTMKLALIELIIIQINGQISTLLLKFCVADSESIIKSTSWKFTPRPYILLLYCDSDPDFP